MIPRPEAVDLFRLERRTALLATSRATEFLRGYGCPATGQETLVQAAIAGLFHAGRADDAPPPSPDDIQRALAAAGVTEAAAMTGWIVYQAARDDRALCAEFWRGVLTGMAAPEDAGGPPGDDMAGGDMARKWQSLRAVGEGRPQDAPAPDPLADRAAWFAGDVAPLDALDARIGEWQDGPFSDLDLRLAERFDWPVAEGLMWSGWQDMIARRRASLLWARFSGGFDAAEKQAILDWLTARATENRRAAIDDGIDPAVADALFPAPPCHPDEISDADL